MLNCGNWTAADRQDLPAAPPIGQLLEITEVKNVKSLSLTRQLKDLSDLVGPKGTLNVFIKKGTKISKPLRDAAESELSPIKILREL